MSSQELDGVSRRRFLSHSLWSVGWLTSSDWAAAARKPSGTTEVALAYWRESDQLSNLDSIAHTTLPFFVDETGARLPEDVDGTSATLVDARRLMSGDPEFIGRHARVTLHGMFVEPDTSLTDLPSLSIHMGGGEAPRFHAWSFDSGVVARVSSPVSLQVPVSAEGIHLGIRTDDGSIDTSLCTGTALFSPKLRRGIYLLSWARSTSASLSRGQGLSWTPAENGAIRTRLSSSSKRSQRLAHVLLSVDSLDEGELLRGR